MKGAIAGHPRTLRCHQRNPRSADGPLNSIVSAVKSALERTPPELGADIRSRHGADGGGALLRDVDRLLMEETGLPVVVADDPRRAWSRLWQALENMEKPPLSLPRLPGCHGLHPRHLRH